MFYHFIVEIADWSFIVCEIENMTCILLNCLIWTWLFAFLILLLGCYRFLGDAIAIKLNLLIVFL